MWFHYKDIRFACSCNYACFESDPTFVARHEKKTLQSDSISFKFLDQNVKHVPPFGSIRTAVLSCANYFWSDFFLKKKSGHGFLKKLSLPCPEK